MFLINFLQIFIAINISIYIAFNILILGFNLTQKVNPKNQFTISNFNFKVRNLELETNFIRQKISFDRLVINSSNSQLVDIVSYEHKFNILAVLFNLAANILGFNFNFEKSNISVMQVNLDLDKLSQIIKTLNISQATTKEDNHKDILLNSEYNSNSIRAIYQKVITNFNIYGSLLLKTIASIKLDTLYLRKEIPESSDIFFIKTANFLFEQKANSINLDFNTNFYEVNSSVLTTDYSLELSATDARVILGCVNVFSSNNDVFNLDQSYRVFFNTNVKDNVSQAKYVYVNTCHTIDFKRINQVLKLSETIVFENALFNLKSIFIFQDREFRHAKLTLNTYSQHKVNYTDDNKLRQSYVKNNKFLQLGHARWDVALVKLRANLPVNQNHKFNRHKFDIYFQKYDLPVTDFIFYSINRDNYVALKDSNQSNFSLQPLNIGRNYLGLYIDTDSLGIKQISFSLSSINLDFFRKLFATKVLDKYLFPKKTIRNLVLTQIYSPNNYAVISNVEFRYSLQEKKLLELHLNFNILDINYLQHKIKLHLENFSLRLQDNLLKLSSNRNVGFWLEGLYQEKFSLYLPSEFRVKLEDKYWYAIGNSIHINKNLFVINAIGDYQRANMLEVTADFKNLQALKYFLPYRIFNPNLSKWLKRALVSGKTTKLKAQISNDFGSFKYDLSEAINIKNKSVANLVSIGRRHVKRGLDYKVQINSKDFKLKFLPEWQAFTKMNLQLFLDKDKIAIKSSMAKFGDLDVNSIDAKILDLQHRSQLIVDYKVKGSLHGVKQLFLQNPLAENLNLTKFFNEFADFDTKTTLKANNRLSFYFSGQDAFAVKVKGEVAVSGGSMILFTKKLDMDYPVNKLHLQKLIGTLKYDNYGIYSNNLIFNILGHKANAKINTHAGKVSINAIGNMDLAKIIPMLSNQVQYKLNLNIDEGVSLNLDIAYNNLLINPSFITTLSKQSQKILWQLLGKINQANHYKHYKAKLVFVSKNESDRFDLKLGNNLHYELQRNVTKDRKRSNVTKELFILNVKTNEFPQLLELQKILSHKSFMIFNLEQLNWELARLFTNESLLNFNINSENTNDAIRNYQIKSDNIFIYKNNTFNNLKLSINDSNEIDGNIYGTFKAKEAAGEFIYTKNSNILDMQITRLEIPKISNDNNDKITKKISMEKQVFQKSKQNDNNDCIYEKKLNARVKIDNFSYKGKWYVDRINFDLVNKKNQFVLNNVKLQKNKNSILGSINWNKQDSTKLQFQATIRDLNDFLSNFGHKDKINSQSGTLNAHLKANKHPLCMSTKDLQGSINAKFNNGTFISFNPGVSRLLGLLNLEHYLKRLQYGFQDLEEDNLFFASMNLNLQLKPQLQANLQSLTIDTPGATANLNGEIDFEDSNLQLHAKITPTISGALSNTFLIAGTLNPLGALGVYLSSKLIEDRVFHVNYIISGDFANPKFELLQ